MANITIAVLADNIASQKRKLAARNKEIKEQAAKIESLEKQLKREARKLKKESEIAAYLSSQLDKFKATNKKLRKEQKGESAISQELEALLKKASVKIEQLQQALDEERKTVERLNQNIIEANQSGLPPQQVHQSLTPTTRLIAKLESGAKGSYQIQGGAAGSLGSKPRRAKHR